jgi:host factor-I protein
MEKSTAQNIQDGFLNNARRERIDVSFLLLHGSSIKGRIKSFDKFSLTLDCDGVDVLLFKHAIATISVERKKI